MDSAELGTGGYTNKAHCDPDYYLQDLQRVNDLKCLLADSGIAISALSCHGNPVHPDPARAEADHRAYVDTVRLANLLEVDPVAAIRMLSNCIYHVHAKDCRIDGLNTGRAGVLDTKNYGEILNRSWVFRTVGYGHGEEVWRNIISNLRMVGYDRAISIEHEDGLMSINEGLEKAVIFLKPILIDGADAEMWWA